MTATVVVREGAVKCGAAILGAAPGNGGARPGSVTGLGSFGILRAEKQEHFTHFA
jgi:hypothetical protein